jgi:hypothetical protein
MDWQIERLFGCLKTRGFRMEDTHIVDGDKIERLIFVLAIAFCWSYHVGDTKDKEKPTPIKTHRRPAKSLFRRGLDELQRVIFKKLSPKKIRELLKCFIHLNPGKFSVRRNFCPVQGYFSFENRGKSKF